PSRRGGACTSSSRPCTATRARRPAAPTRTGAAGDALAEHGLPRLRARQPDRPRRVAARRRPGHAEAAGGGRRGRGRPAVAVRGADRARDDGDPPLARHRPQRLGRGDQLLSRARRLQHRPRRHLEHVAAAKRALSVPVVASLNGSSRGGWVQHARLIEQAGADALELNVYAVEADPLTTAEEAETRILDVVRAVRAELRIPLAVKIGPFFTALAHTAARMVVAGADGLVLFNRFLQPDIDLEALAVVDRLELSRREELRLPLRWIALLHGRVPISLAATSGVHEAEDVLKALLAGADVAMPASALIRQGPAKLAEMVTGVER